MASSSTIRLSSNPPAQPATDQGEDLHKYLSLYKAALRDEWDTAKEILEKEPLAVKARIALHSQTALHVAVGNGKDTGFLANLVNKMDDESVALKADTGETALYMAASQGNTAAARILVERLPELLYIPSELGAYPVHKAAMCGHRDTLQFLISVTRDDLDPNPYAGAVGFLLLHSVICVGFFDIALELLGKYPHVAERYSSLSALQTVALKDTAFESGARFNFWERLIYSSIQLATESELGNVTQNSSDIENPNCGILVCSEFQRWHRLVLYLQSTLCQFMKRLVPDKVKELHEQKIVHHQALKLVKCLCQHMEGLTHDEASSIYVKAVVKAARLGIKEIIEVVVEAFPEAIYSCDLSTRQHIFHLAVINRCEKVFNLTYQMSDRKHQFSDLRDYSGNNVLHLVAKLAPPHKLNLVSGAALQMQQEIQWFKAVENFVSFYSVDEKNHAGETPKMIFTEEHKNLKIEGEKWMKDTANSCTISAALIATVVFAAAITVPGGNESDSGYPMFSKSSAFIIFAVSDAISLFTSTTSLLMFLSILTSRYAEEDFLYALPKRLCIGLVTLFLSISFMIAAFSATIILVFGRMHAWVLIPVAALACLPVSSFVLLQFPLLVDVISSTYGGGIFGKQSDRLFY